MSILFKNADILSVKDGRFEYLQCAYLGVEGKVIDYIGTEAPVKEYSEVKEMSGKMLIPGLVNSHGHTAMNLLRGLGSSLDLQQWLAIMWPIEDRMRDEDCANGMNMAILEMLASGTTSFCDMYMSPGHTKHASGRAE